MQDTEKHGIRVKIIKCPKSIFFTQRRNVTERIIFLFLSTSVENKLSMQQKQVSLRYQWQSGMEHIAV